MSVWLSIEVRFLNGRYHGRDANAQPDWPPTPLRLFQAIVAGALSGRWAVEDRAATEAALRRLESLGAPRVLLGPDARRLQPYCIAVPNNQSDQHLLALTKGTPFDKLVASDRELKVVWPRLVGRGPLVYAWPIEGDGHSQAEEIRSIVRRLIVLGTGLDHATADVMLSSERPTFTTLISFDVGASPCEGTTDSLTARWEADRARLKAGILRESRPPVRSRSGKTSARSTAYLFFTIRTPREEADALLPIEPNAAAVVAQAIRVTLGERLVNALRKRSGASPAPVKSVEEVDRLVTGRGATAAESARRVRVVPLPSVGHDHADGLLRRVLVIVAGDFPIAPETVRRALVKNDFEIETVAGHRLKFRLAAIDEANDGERRMRERYLGRARLWRSVSPVILPGRRSVVSRTEARGIEREEATARARADAERRRDEERLFDRALTHAGLKGVVGFQLRREPFGPHHPRADAAWRLPASTTENSSVWLANRPRVHAEITLNRAQSGPILIGDGRFLGLGLFRAVTDETPGFPEAVRYHLVHGRPPFEQAVLLAHTVRRILTSKGRASPEFSGEHKTFHDLERPRAFFLSEDTDGDGLIDNLTIYSRLGFSDNSLERLRKLRHLWLQYTRSSLGRLEVTLSEPEIGMPMEMPGLRGLMGPSKVWRSVTPYVGRNHQQQNDKSRLVVQDKIRDEWSRYHRGLPEPQVEELEGSQLSKCETAYLRGVRASRNDAVFLRLTFPDAVMGPIVLGHFSHFGLGHFVAEDRR